MSGPLLTSNPRESIMNPLKWLSAKFCGTRISINSDQVMEHEKARIEPAFRDHFDRQHSQYLNSDYQEFLDKIYPEYVRQHYNYIDPEKYPYRDRPWYGLALSGGGIRSASFGIGVIQALKNPFFFEGKPSIFDKLAYQSSVSGGGYTGAALQWYQKAFNIFPFGKITSFAGSHYSEDPGDRVLSHIRQHGKYLTPYQLGVSSLIGVLLLSSFHSVLAYTLLFTAFFLGVISIVQFLPTPGLGEMKSLFDWAMYFTDSVPAELGPRVLFGHFFVSIAVFLASIFGLLTLVYAFSSFTKTWFSKAYCYRVAVQKSLGRILLAIALALFLALLPLAFTLAVGKEPDLSKDKNIMATSLTSGVVGGVLALFNFYKSLGQSVLGKQRSLKVITLVTVVLAVFSIFLVAYGLAEYFHSHLSFIWSLALVGAAVAVPLVVNINQISPHKMYRDRLMETFMETPGVPTEAALCKHSQQANEALLADLEHSPHWSPYHLINCNVILNNAIDPRFRGRAGDSFLLSSLYCGSDATGYTTANEFAGGTLTLATAMSISGAAANPYAGNSGEGPSLNPLVAFLMTFFGLRLGYWAFSPANVLHKMSRILRPNYLLPGLAGLLDLGHTEKGAFVELSDGGHFDNTGIYELIRRRVPVIVLADGGADPNFSFDDLGSAIERVRVDFGVSIRFIHKDFDLSDLLPGSKAYKNADSELYDEKYSLSKRGYAIGDIVYPSSSQGEAFVGRLVYVKASLTRNLPADLYAYKASNPSYPDQSTLDQFFDERQFEAYRELGYQLTKQMVQDKKAMALLP